MTMAFRSNRTYYLVLDMAAPEYFGLKTLRGYDQKFLRVKGNVAIPLSGFLERPENIITDVQAFHVRYSNTNSTVSP